MRNSILICLIGYWKLFRRSWEFLWQLKCHRMFLTVFILERIINLIVVIDCIKILCDKLTIFRYLRVDGIESVFVCFPVWVIFLQHRIHLMLQWWVLIKYQTYFIKSKILFPSFLTVDPAVCCYFFGFPKLLIIFILLYKSILILSK